MTSEYHKPVVMLVDDDEIDLLFLDIKMPKISGFEFLRRAKADIGPNFAKAVVILTTLTLAEMHLERAITDEVVKGFFQKPLEPDDLRRAARIIESKPPRRRSPAAQHLGAG